MTVLAATSYDDVLYPAGTFEHTHPRRLATLATLFGMKPAPVERCRVLELGCGVGANLIPMAAALPASTFHGIDLAARPIATGRAQIEALGLHNITLEQRDILDLVPEPGSFDYVIAHGVYSWVPAHVRDAVLTISRRALAPQGIAYLSFNTLPGAYTRLMMREMIAFHTRDLTEPAARLAQGRALMGFLAENIPARHEAHKNLVMGQRERLGRLEDGYVLHDDLAEICEPFYLHQVVKHATSHGLAYLAEAVFADMADQMYPPRVREMLASAPDLVTQQQYLDFLCGRAFHRLLLCRDDVSLERRLDAESVKPFYMLGRATAVSERPEVTGPSVERFTNPGGLTVGLDAPVAKAAMVILAESVPRALAFDELLAAIEARVGEAPDPHELGELLLAMYGGDMVELCSHRPEIVSQAGERPRTTALARLQATEGPRLSSLWHTNVRLMGPLPRRLAALLDGERDRAALAAIVDAEGLVDDLAGLTDPEARKSAVLVQMEAALRELAELGLLSA
ncbi:Methyltransferase [Minicystis rosea]|nr:Methyltransferase [Minicystis rosea]